MPVVDPVKCVARIASKAGLTEKTKRKALEILKKAEEGKISAGKRSYGSSRCCIICGMCNEWRKQDTKRCSRSSRCNGSNNKK